MNRAGLRHKKKKALYLIFTASYKKEEEIYFHFCVTLIACERENGGKKRTVRTECVMSHCVDSIIITALRHRRKSNDASFLGQSQARNLIFLGENILEKK